MDERKTGADADFGLGGLFKGLGDLIEAASKLSEKGEGISKSGEIDFSGLSKIKGLQDLKGVLRLSGSVPWPTEDPRCSHLETSRRNPPKVRWWRKCVSPSSIFSMSRSRLMWWPKCPALMKGDIQLDIKGDILNISAEGKNRKYQKEVLLSREAAAENMTWAYKNGMLEIRIPTTDGK